MRKLIAAIALSLMALLPSIPAIAQQWNSGNERAFREPTRFYKPVRFSFGPGVSGAPPQAGYATGVLSSLNATASSATGAATNASLVLPANTLTTTGKSVRVRVFGTTAANGNTKVVNFKFGSTTIALLNAASNNKDFYADIEIYRTGANAQQISVAGYANNALLNGLSTTSAQAETSPITMQVNMPASTGAADVVLLGFTVIGES